MFDLGLSTAGTSVSLASSADPDFSPENIIDGRPDTFWLTTGMFPQEFVLTFASLMNINNIKLTMHNVRRISIEKSLQASPVDFQPVREASLEGSDGEIITHDFSLSEVEANHLRFTIESGYNHFISIHELHIDGNATRG